MRGFAISTVAEARVPSAELSWDFRKAAFQATRFSTSEPRAVSHAESTTISAKAL